MTHRDVCLYQDAALASYHFGASHPFGPDRLAAFQQECRKQGLDHRVTLTPAVACNEADLLRFHTAEYIERVQQQSQSGVGALDYGDTPAFKGMYEATSYVVGSVLDGARRILAGECKRCFLPIAGLHHARRDAAAGFCIFNDIGVLIETLRSQYGIQRIAYIDIDAHHGDGVFYSFESDPDLIFIDLHEDGRYLYPGTGMAHETGSGDAIGSKLNLPLAPGSDDTVVLELWPQVEDFVRQGRPEFILLQAGADSLAGDPLTHLQLSPRSHGHAATQLRALADELCHGRLLAMGGGGYDRHNLASAWNAVLAAMV